MKYVLVLLLGCTLMPASVLASCTEPYGPLCTIDEHARLERELAGAIGYTAEQSARLKLIECENQLSDWSTAYSEYEQCLAREDLELVKQTCKDSAPENATTEYNSINKKCVITCKYGYTEDRETPNTCIIRGLTERQGPTDSGTSIEATVTSPPILAETLQLILPKLRPTSPAATEEVIATTSAETNFSTSSAIEPPIRQLPWWHWLLPWNWFT